MFSAFETVSRRQHGYQRARAEICPVVGPVEPRHDLTDQYIGVSYDRAVGAAILENQTSLAELYRRFIQSSGEGATSQELIVLFRQKVRLASTKELCSSLLAKDKKKSGKRMAALASFSTKQGRKKTLAQAFSIPLEERSHDQVPLTHHHQTLGKETKL